MAASLWNDLLHLLKSLCQWVFCWKLGHRRSKRSSTTVLPIASPSTMIAQGITINICAPPEDLLAVNVPSIVNLPDNPQILGKKELLGYSNSSRVKPRHQDEKQLTGHSVSEPSIPSIRVQNRENTQSKLSDMQPLSNKPVSTVSPSSSVPLALDTYATTSPFMEPSSTPSNPLLEALSQEFTVFLRHGELVGSHECPRPNLGQDVGSGERQDFPGPSIFESSTEVPKSTFEPIRYAPSALSAVSECNFWDIPSDDPARMVPLPLFTSTPPKPCSRLSTDQTNTRLSLLPYTDLFDFSMYNSRVSQDDCDGFYFGRLPPDITTPLSPATEPNPTSQVSEIAYRDRYRNSAYSKPTGPYNPASTPVKVVPASNRFSSSVRKRLRDISLNSIAFNSPLTKRISANDVCDSSFSMYSQSSAPSVDLSTKSLEDITTCLHSACDNLSRCIWTDEEFMKLVLE